MYTARVASILLLPILLIACAAPAAPPTSSTSEEPSPTPQESGGPYAEQRAALLDDIKAMGIKDEKVLHAMEVVPRHAFVPAEYLEQAYANHPLPIGYGQTISQPYIVAWMTELLELQPGERVLEIG
ncbi:MAG: hypothetical protein FIA98_14015, partial [Anaerolineae bacterium]|nr:hypothetical protein [Anaerolineae bacterium]